MKPLLFLILFPALAYAGPYYEVVNSTTAGTSSMTISGYIGLAASSTTSTTYTIYLNGKSGKVGISTHTPRYPLEVYGATSDASLSTGTALTLGINSGGIELGFGWDNTSPYPYWMQTRNYNVGDTAYPLVLNPLGGNVGIGTLSPVSTLDVNGTFNVGVTTFSVASGEVMIGTTVPVGAQLTISKGNVNLEIWSDGSSSFVQSFNRYSADYADMNFYGTAFTFNGSSMTRTCPTGFVAVKKLGWQMSCIQISTNGAATDCLTAADNCFDSYGGKLPTISELFIARYNGFGLASGSEEWTDSGYAVVGVNAYCGTLTGGGFPNGQIYSAATLYRCSLK